MSKGLHIAICEDEKKERDKLLRLLDESGIENTYSVFFYGEELLADFEQGKYDLILMDIYMGSELTDVEIISYHYRLVLNNHILRQTVVLLQHGNCPSIKKPQA